MRKGILVTVIIVFILTFLFHVVLAEDKKEPDMLYEELQTTIEKMGLQKELVKQRSVHRRSFKDSKGKITTFIATSPLNYLGDDNQYYPIETSIVSEKSIPQRLATFAIKGNSDKGNQSRSRNWHHALKNTVKARFADESDGGAIFEYQKKSILFQVDHPYKRRAKISDNKVRYEKIFDDCDLEYTILPGRVKDEFIFYSLPKKPILSFRVDFGDLIPQNGPEGSINLVDTSGNIVFTIHPSFMFEKENEEKSKAIETRFHRKGDQLYCDLVLDMGWLKDKKRNYPVVVDPQVSVGELYSHGQSNQRFLFYAPETNGTIDCDIKINGPHMHGHLSKHDEAKGHFKDLTADKTFLYYKGLHDYHENHEEPLVAGHYYEIAVYGGRTKHKIGGGKFYGDAWAIITYGDANGSLFEEVPPKVLSVKVHNIEVEKTFEIKYPQDISYTSNSNASPNFKVFQIGDEEPVFTPSSNNGTFHLKDGMYKIVVPQNAWAEFAFPRLTGNYESRILMRSNPGIIDSAFILPSKSEIKMQFKTEKNGTPGSLAYPFVRILSDTETIYERKFDVNYYKYFDGGDKVTLEKEVPYRLIISRGQNMQSGWGSVEFDVYHPQNQPCSVTDFRLVDNQNNPVQNGYANGNYKLSFIYTDTDENPLKDYKLTIEQTNSTSKHEYWLNPTEINTGIINIPYLIRQFNFDSGSEILCRVNAWDGFDFFEMSTDYKFTLDLTPPTIDTFSGEVVKADNSLKLECQARDLQSGLKSTTVSWTVNGKPGGSRELSQGELAFSIPNLPWNARVVATMDAVDNTDNKASRTLVFYTYPQKATLLAPAQTVSQRKADLKISKAEASYIRIERYLKAADDSLKLDYDTGYMDPSQIGQSIVGYPQVCLSTPSSGSSFEQPAIINLSADAFDINGRITQVNFYNGSDFIGAATQYPYNCTWSNVPAGSYQIIAKAIDDDGLEAVSSPVNITVKNSLPTVIITNPKQNQTFTWPCNITIEADAFDNDGSITEVDFYVGNTLIGTSIKSSPGTENSYNITWNNVPTGSHTLIVKATDNNGAVNSSAPVTITVTPPPLHPYRIHFNCHHENTGVKNTYTMYLPADRPVPGNYTFGPLDWGYSTSINGVGNIKRIPCKIRVNYTLKIENKSEKHHQHPYFRVTLANGQQLVNRVFINDTRSGSFVIPADTYVRIQYYSGHHENKHTIGDDDDYGYQSWCTLSFEYILDKTNTAFAQPVVNSINSLESVNVTKNPAYKAYNELESENNQKQVYSLPEPEPARNHETYVYRIYTKNGDKEVWQDSQPVPVLNNLPQILAMEPVPGLTSYSYHTLKFKLFEVIDQDDDSLTYTYRISGKRSTGEDYTYGPVTRTDQDPVTVTNLPDGNYTWTVEVMDEYQGVTNVSGNIIVDKGQPIASFNINGGNRFTNNPSVKVNIGEAYNVYRVRFSYDNINWMDPVTDWNNPIHLTLPAGEGKKVLYMQAQTEAQASTDAWGPPVSIQRSIILDTTPPDCEHFTVFDQGGTGSVYFHWGGGNDNLSSINGYNVQKWKDFEWTDIHSDDNRVIIPATGYNMPVKVRIQLFDKAGNVSDWIEATGYTKAAPGSLNIAETTSGYSPEEGHYIRLKLNPAEGTTEYKLICVENSGGGDIAVVDSDTLSYLDTGLIPHGIYKYKLQTFNTSGEITETELELIQIANIPPDKPTGLGPKGYITDTSGITINLDRPLEHLDVDGDPLEIKYYLSADDTSYVELPNEFLNDLTDGQSYFWKARLSDGYGGTVETDPVSFTVDITPPMINVDNISFDWGLEHRVRILATDNGSGIASLVVNGIPGDFSREVLVNEQGANLLTITSTDRAGNTANFSHIYYVDQTQPVASNVRFDLPENNGNYLTGVNLVPTVWEGTDPETGIKRFRYAWSESNGWYDPSNMQDVTLMDRQGTYQHNFLGDFEDGQIYYLFIQAENRLGVKSATIQSAPLLYDHTRPLLNITELTGGRYFNGFYYLSLINNLNLTIDSNDPHSGISTLEYALTETVNPETVQWFGSLSELKNGTTLVNGKVYYLAVRATNGTGLTTTVYSDPLVFDSSAPIITVTNSDTQKDNQVYFTHVTVRDQETMVINLQYAIGSDPGATNLSKGLPGADSNGWITLQYPVEAMELRQYADIPVGSTYYFTVKAANISGEIATATTSGTKVITGDSPVVRDDGSHTSEKEALHFEWTYPNSPGVIRFYEYQIRSDEGVIKEWTETEDTSLVVTNLQLQHNFQYYCDVRAVYDGGGDSPVGTSDGIRVDLTLPEITEFCYPVYSDGSGILLTWATSDPESGVKCFAGVGTNPGETGVTKGWLSLGNLKQYRVCQDVDGIGIKFSHGKSYYLTLLVENGSGLTVQQISTPITIDLTAPEPPVVIDEGNYTNHNDQLKFSWKWPLDDYESGIREYWYALTTQRAINGSEEWYCSLLEKEVLIDDLKLLQGGTYYLAVKAVNNAGSESVGFSDGILVDTTAPTPPMVLDYGDFSLSKSELNVSMVASDAESGVAEYRLSLGTLENPESIFANRPVMSSGGVEHINLTGLNLDEGQVYLFTITAVNQAGITSMSSTSDGIMVDSKLPEIAEVKVQGRYLTDQTKLGFDWKVRPCPSGVIDAQYAISDNPSGAELIWQSADLAGSQIVTDLNLVEGKIYYVYVRVQNRALANNSPDIWSVPGRSSPISIDTSPPEIISIHTPKLMPRHFLLQWEARDNVSGITEYRYAVGSYRRGNDVTDGWVSVVSDKTTYSNYRDDLPLHNNRDYYISVMAKNGAGLWSPVYTGGAIKTELTPPRVSKLSYPSAYFNLKDYEEGIQIDWAADDEESGMAAYRIQFVTEKDNQDLNTAAVLTNKTSGSIHLTEFNLTDGREYYLAFQAQNGLGAWSGVYYTDEILVDLSPPVVSIEKDVEEFVTNDGRIAMTWQVNEACNVEYLLTYPNGRQPEAETVMITEDYVHNFEFPVEVEGVYSLELQPTDLAGNPGSIVTDKIRLNAKPFANPGPDRRVFKGGTVTFEPHDVSDKDGTVVEYLWDFGNDEISREVTPSRNYQELGEYTVTLQVMDNDGKWSDPVTAKVIVTNTTSGPLAMDEDWEGEADIAGDITVPRGVTLRIKAGTKIDFLGDYQIKVYGRILIEGSAVNPVIIGAETTTWTGIRLINSDPGSVVQYTEIHSATAGLIVAESDLTVENSLLKNNRIGIHVIKSAPHLQNCILEENLVYGVKEDNGATPSVIDCSFIRNETIDYYEDELGIIRMERLNELGENKGNTKIE